MVETPFNPYASPSREASEPAATAAEGEIPFARFRPLDGLFQPLALLSLLLAACDVLVAVTFAWQRQLVHPNTQQQAMAEGLVGKADQLLIGLIHIRLGLAGAAGIVFLVWLHRAVSNLRVLDPAGREQSAARAVLEYFLPSGLITGYYTMQEAWARSDPAAVGRPPSPQGERSPLIPLWWFGRMPLWLLDVAIMRADVRTSDEWLWRGLACIVFYAAMFPVHLIFVRVVGQITRRQSQRIERIDSVAPGPAAVEQPLLASIAPLTE